MVGQTVSNFSHVGGPQKQMKEYCTLHLKATIKYCIRKSLSKI